jgi:antitoxin PrlF
MLPAPSDEACVSAFLDLLARDMDKNPHRIQPLDPALLRRVRELTRGVVIDLDEPLAADDE